MRWRATTASLVVALLVPLLLLPGRTRAQAPLGDASPVVVGSRVRLWAPAAGYARVVGMVTALDDESLYVGMGDRPPVTIPRWSINRLELSVGRDTRTRQGMLVGAGAGVFLGALIYSNRRADSGDSWVEDLDLLMAASTVMAGPVVGAVIGAMTRGDRWGTVPLEHVRMGLAPARGQGGALVLSVSF